MKPLLQKYGGGFTAKMSPAVRNVVFLVGSDVEDAKECLDFARSQVNAGDRCEICVFVVYANCKTCLLMCMQYVSVGMYFFFFTNFP